MRAVPDSAKIWRCDSDYRPLDLVAKERFTEWLSKSMNWICTSYLLEMQLDDIYVYMEKIIMMRNTHLI